MLLNKELFGSIAKEVVRSPRLRMLYDLCDSEKGDNNLCSMYMCL